MHERDPDVPQQTRQRVGAAIRGGMVTCVTCKRRLPLREADGIGLSYRCMACSHLAELASLPAFAKGTGPHVALTEQTSRSESQLVVGGIGVITIGGVLSMVSVFALGLSAIGVGAGMIVIGLVRRGAAK